ncbi:MAG: hypothetical protein ACPG77_09740, partial [Nannocystaceae bacterium]
MHHLTNRITLLLPALVCIAMAGCSPTGTVQVFIEAEASIQSGLEANDGNGSDDGHDHDHDHDHRISDGWSVDYDVFVVAFGGFLAERSAAPGDQLELTETIVLDLTQLPAGGYVVGSVEGASAERYDRVSYSLVTPTAEATKPDFTDAAYVDQMIDQGHSLYFEATLTHPEGVSCCPQDGSDCVMLNQVEIAWGAAVPTTYGDCASESGDAGFAVPSGGTVQVKPTIHGEHWFFTSFTQGAEITDLRAGWVAAADLDCNGTTTVDELKQVPAADVFPAAI